MKLYRRKPTMVEAIQYTDAESLAEISRRMGLGLTYTARLFDRGDYLVMNPDGFMEWCPEGDFNDEFEPLLPSPSIARYANLADDYAYEFRNHEGALCACGEAVHVPSEHTCGRTPEGDLPHAPDAHERKHE